MVRSTIAAALLFAVCDAVTLTTESPLSDQLLLAVPKGSSIVNLEEVKNFKDLWSTVDDIDKNYLVIELMSRCYGSPEAFSALYTFEDKML